MIDTSRAMNGDSANKFISALVKSLQTLCHGYVEFNDGIEIIGHLYLNIDSGSSFDYVVKEKVCKNAENSTVFVSKSFQAQAPAEECIIRKEKDDEHSVFEDSSNMSPTTGTSSRLQSAITSISNVLSGTQHDSHKSRLIDHSTHHPPSQNTSKRKREHNGSYSSMQPPYKYTTLQATSSSYFNSALSSAKQAGDRNHSEHFSNPPHSEFFGGESNQSSGMGHDDEDDLDLDVTFVKEEFESQRNSGQRGVTASRLSQDPSSSQSNMLHDSGGLGYSTNHHQAPQQFASGTAGDMGSLSQSFQDPSQLDMSQHSSQGPPNPRTLLASHARPRLMSPPSPAGSIFDLSVSPRLSLQNSQKAKGQEILHTMRQTKWAVARAQDDASAGPPSRMPEGVKPLCGYVHPDDAKKWMMFELLPGSGVFIHQENYNVVLSKTRQDRPDGKAMARYLMSCFWRQSELVGASIAEPPKPHQKSLDRGIIHAILGFCQHHSRELATDIRRTIQQKIGYAKFYFVKKTQDPDSPKTTPASISVEASPRRMSMEMARRGVGGLPLDLPMKAHTGRRGRRSSESLARGLPQSDELPMRLAQRGTPDVTSRNYSEITGDISSSDMISGRLPTSTPGDLISDRLQIDLSGRITAGDLTRRMSVDMSGRLSNDFSGRVPTDLTSRISADASNRLPDDLSTRSASNLSTRSSDVSAVRMSSDISVRTPINPLEAMSVRTSETSLSDLANRMGSMPAGMSRGFLDMLNNIYPSN